MLKLTDITKIYGEKGEGVVNALKGISLTFRPCEFVSILGPSGCGKTTLLNIIGGLDRYSSGDLNIRGVSTKDYGDTDWDTYRNHSIGFIFQSYNLIPHQTVLENVELTMTLGGVAKDERRRRAKAALEAVGLSDKLNKRPNQLSGGQMQRVSIARALVGDPDIILADEPTGALDSETSESVMEILKEISKSKLVIMVTHNPDLAVKYSDRIIRMLDGVVIEDTNPYLNEGETESYMPAKETETIQSEPSSINYRKKHSSMSLFTAFKLSWRNLLSKRKRTIITSLAASIGLIGIAIILSVSSGMQAFIDQTMLDSASFNYIMISETMLDSEMLQENISSIASSNNDKDAYPENTTGITPYQPQSIIEYKLQNLSDEFISYIEEKTAELIIDISYTYDVNLNIVTKNGDDYVSVNSSNWGEALNNSDYLSDYYTTLASLSGDDGVPSSITEVAIVVDRYNRLSTSVLTSLGIPFTATEDGKYEEIKYEDILGKEFRVVYNDGWYTPMESDGTTLYANAKIANNLEGAYKSEHGVTVKVVSVLRENKDASASWLEPGIVYSPALTQAVLKANKSSEVALAQAANDAINLTTGTAFSAYNTQASVLKSLGYTQSPSTITIYPTSTHAREEIIEYLNAWNTVKEGTDEVVDFYDMSAIVTTMMGTIVDTITYVLMAFSITSLVISSIMIAIIIYASVIERVKEIGVLRSIGARKKDVSRVFRAEAIILGLLSGVAAIIITLIANVIINMILNSLVGVSTIARLEALTAIGLLVLSAVLLLIASLIPASLAAKKEPAVALRTE
ncbi:MAG: ATP-binding cassette domain-containing protein [Clostridiales bacterium]|nr:ATP-binding cassette domain-containing protein [Clostridiales bacterium]